MKVTDSNTWGGNSGHTYTLTRQPDGGTMIDAVVVRDGKNFKGKLIEALLGNRSQGSTSQRRLGKTVKAIEARNGGASTKNPGNRNASSCPMRAHVLGEPRLQGAVRPTWDSHVGRTLT